MWLQGVINSQAALSSISVPHRTILRLGYPYLKELKMITFGSTNFLRIKTGSRVIFPVHIGISGDGYLTSPGSQDYFYANDVPLGYFQQEFNDIWAKLEHPYDVTIEHFSTGGNIITQLWFNVFKEQSERSIIAIDPDDSKGNQ